MINKILVVKDPENEVGFTALCEYSENVQKVLGSNVLVLPVWPKCDIKLLDINDEDDVEFHISTIKNSIKNLESQLKKGEKTDE